MEYIYIYICIWHIGCTLAIIVLFFFKGGSIPNAGLKLRALEIKT